MPELSTLTEIDAAIDIRGTLFQIQRFSVHDGPGIRTTVFFKGCPLRCKWCHNPEGMDRAPQVSFIAERCLHCGVCEGVCESGVHAVTPDSHTLERSACTACGMCADSCPASAVELVGREYTVTEVVGVVIRDEPFYRTSGGGITLSGGEPLAQIDFTEALLTEAKRRSLHCCVETSGYATFATIARIQPMVDLFLYDLKETDDERHKAYTGVSNRVILENLRRLHDDGAQIRLRLPLIPGVNDCDDHLSAAAKLIETLPNLEGVEIMPYHRLGLSKSDRFGTTAALSPDIPEPSAETIAHWRDMLGLE